jgi:hypothetical protein
MAATQFAIRVRYPEGMAITLELRPDVEDRLVAQALAKGMPVDKYVEKLIEKDPVKPAEPAKSPEEIRQRLMELAAEAHALPRLNHRTPDEIIAYDEIGLPL